MLIKIVIAFLKDYNPQAYGWLGKEAKIVNLHV